MPVWGQIILGVAAVLTAVIVIWQKALKPGAKLISNMDRMLPLLGQLTEQFHDAPNAFKTLKEISFQFRADSGTSLRDVVNRLEETSRANSAAAEVLRVQQESLRQLAEQDRGQIARLIVLLDKVNAKVDIDARGRVVIADNLEASHQRAEATAGANSGEAADAAAIRPEGEQ